MLHMPMLYLKELGMLLINGSLVRARAGEPLLPLASISYVDFRPENHRLFIYGSLLGCGLGDFFGFPESGRSNTFAGRQKTTQLRLLTFAYQLEIQL